MGGRSYGKKAMVVQTFILQDFVENVYVLVLLATLATKPSMHLFCAILIPSRNDFILPMFVLSCTRLGKKCQVKRFHENVGVSDCMARYLFELTETN